VKHPDLQGFDAEEQEEWLDALEGVLKREGVAAASALLQSLAGRLTRTGASLPFAVSTPYRNTIPSADETPMPGDLFMERRIRSLIRWNALAMVVRANRRPGDLGGHISSFASSATLYDVGFNYFFRAPEPADADGNVSRSGDLVYFQGHASPGIYARSFLEGRLSEEQLDNFRRETGSDGLSSYPHPWLMPDYWQFPTVSMGLGPFASDLPSPRDEVFRLSRLGRNGRSQGVGISWRWRV
jgi:pyruvate dehydrogenase E1 component